MENNAIKPPYHFLRDGGETGQLIRNTDWTAAGLGDPDTWPEGLKSAVRSMLDSPVATSLFVGPKFIHLYNDAFIPTLGQTRHPMAMGQPVKVRAQVWEFIEPVFSKVLAGETLAFKDQKFVLDKNGFQEDCYMDLSYAPVYLANGEIIAIQNILIETTDKARALQQQFKAQEKLESSQQELLSYFDESPVGIAIISRDQLIFRMVNPFYCSLVDRKAGEIIGRPLLEALPELKGQGFDDLLNGVIATGLPYIAKEVAVKIQKNNQLETIYVDLTYQARRENDQITGVLVFATDVTQQVISRKKIEEAETFLRGAVELANLGTWSLDLNTRILDYDERLRDWFGFSREEVITIEAAYKPIAEADRPLVKTAMLNAITPGTDSIYDVEYHIYNIINGSERILHAQGMALFNDKHEAYEVRGTAQDVTAERRIELELTRQVQMRTEELAASNEELQAMNEEITTTNEELEESNMHLQRSNSELEQFAYIASHDLQEPVRKISTFSQMLENSLGEISDRSKGYLEKINASSTRMASLIRDVLAYSQLSEKNEQYESVNLSQVFDDARSDFELSIQQKNAVVRSSNLPVIEAIPLQMSQLFGNLLSNALKYSREDLRPEINVSAKLMTQEEIRKIQELDNNKSYFKITFSDNGIGIKEDQIGRIFNIFQRLHGRNEYAGTGIGLSICKKIVQNHHGHIEVISGEQQGTSFHIILPRHFRRKTG